MWATILAGFKAAAAFFGFAEKVTAEVHDANQLTAGKNVIIAEDNAASAKANRDALEVANNLDRTGVDRSLRDGSF